MFYGMPIHIIRDVALTIRSFYKRVTDFVKYRQATKDMNRRYPDATADEIGDENVCIICREGMLPWQAADVRAVNDGAALSNNMDERLRPKKLPCGHILHFACLRSWLERQQNCPTCRQPVLSSASVPQSPAGAAEQARLQVQRNLGAGVIPGPVNQRQAVAGQNRIRFFNLGPIRLGFGAGQDLQGLGEQAGERGLLDAQQNHARADAAHQPYGFGLQLARQQRANNDSVHAPLSPEALQSQLQSIEQQLLREMETLRLQTQQLTTLRAFQMELARLRAIRPPSNATSSTSTRQSPPSRDLANEPSHTTAQFFSVDAQRDQPINAHDTLSGMTVPEGWTLVPLRRLPTGLANTDMQSRAGLYNELVLPHNPSTITPPRPARASATNDVYQQDARIPSSLAPSIARNFVTSSSITTPPIVQARAISSTARNLPSSLEDTNYLSENHSQNPVSESVARTGRAATSMGEGKESISHKARALRSVSDSPKSKSPPAVIAGPSHTSGSGDGDMPMDTDHDHRQAKGKGRAMTVEDVEESD